MSGPDALAAALAADGGPLSLAAGARLIEGRGSRALMLVNPGFVNDNPA